MSATANGGIRLPPQWIEMNINQRECIVFVPSNEDGQICQCGRSKLAHPMINQHLSTADAWIPSVHTKVTPTDAYGTIIFEGEHHPNKSHYVRLSHDTNPELVVQLLSLVWGLPMPKLLISIRGSITNFELSARLGKILQIGLIKAAKSTGAWIFTNGLNRGVAKHVGQSLSNQHLLGLKRGRVVSIGICPFGIVQNREILIGHNKDRIYNALEVSSSNYITLNPRHSNFLFVDNGSVGKLGGESIFRRRLEKCIANYPTSPNRGCDTPLVCLVIGGSFNTLRNIIDYLYDEPPVPVVIFSGTGITADLLTVVLKRISTGLQLDDIHEEVCSLMVKLYSINYAQCGIVFDEIRRIVSRKNLITVYNGSSSESETFDSVLLTAIFRSQHWTPLQQLSLTLVWDRVDIATHEVFVYGRDWVRENLEHAMMEALSANRLNFVELLIEHGLNMQTFLTPKRLEELYSLDRTSSIVTRTLLFELAKIRKSHKRLKGKGSILEKNLTLHDIGFAMSHMMGHVYKSRYSNFKTRKLRSTEDSAEIAMTNSDFHFTQPFDDLFIWAVLTKRHNMAVLLWKHGIGGLAKALVAVRLNKYLVEEFKSTEKTETNLAAEFQSYAELWEQLSYSLLDACFKLDCQMARQLLTMELEHWSSQTCLTLAVVSNHRMLLGHPCSQILLGDLWMGAMSPGKHTTVKVLAGVLFPPLALCCDFKTNEELKLLPHLSKKEGIPNLSLDDQGLLDNASLQTFSKSKGSLPSTVFIERKFRKHSPDDKVYEKKTKKLEKNKHRLPRQHNAPGTIYTRIQGKQSLVGDTDVIILDNSIIVNDTAKVDGEHPHHVTIVDDITSSENSEDSNADGDVVMNKHIALENYYHKDEITRNSYVTTRQELSLFRKLYEFQKAPTANFYRHTIGYFVFIVCLAYVILVPQDQKKVGRVEIYTIAYLVTLGFDTIREFISVDGYSWSQKWNHFQAHNWSLSDLTMILFSLLGTSFRLYPTSERGFFNYGMLIYKVSSIYWNLRLYKYLSNHRWVGPKLVMMSRMLKHMVYFAMIIVVVLIAFGISREAIRFPDSYPTIRSITEAFLEPYVMFYGEIDIDSVSSHCGEEDQAACPPGHWIIPLTWTLYMMVANILIVNVLIAVFNGIYAEVDAIALELWMFQRFTFVMEFQSKPLLPPPFIILCHFYYVIRGCFSKCRSCISDEELEGEGLDIEEGRRVHIGNDRSLKTFLTPTEANRVFDFEEDNLQSLNTLPSEIVYTSKKLETDSFRRFGKQDYGSLEVSENRHLMEMTQKMAEISSELENQRSKLDRIIAYLEEDA